MEPQVDGVHTGALRPLTLGEAVCCVAMVSGYTNRRVPANTFLVYLRRKTVFYLNQLLFIAPAGIRYAYIY